MYELRERDSVEGYVEAPHTIPDDVVKERYVLPADITKTAGEA